jgi:hypothetical protein
VAAPHLWRRVHDSVGREDEVILEGGQGARGDLQLRDAQDLRVAPGDAAQARGEAQVIRYDHGGVQRLEVQYQHLQTERALVYTRMGGQHYASSKARKRGGGSRMQRADDIARCVGAFHSAKKEETHASDLYRTGTSSV